MKLRNKKTGEVVNVIVYSPIGNYNIRIWNDKDYLDPTCNYDEYLGEYKTLADLNKEWEDYTPVEPLIKDEKIRKAVRAWAEALEIECCMYDKGINAFAVGTVMINFPGKLRPETLQNGEIYKIAELCGEEEE